MPVETALCCPHCGNSRVGSNEHIQATTYGKWRQIGSQRVFFSDGDSDVWWDTSTTDEDESCSCSNCGETFPVSKLVEKKICEHCDEDEDDSVQRRANGQWLCGYCASSLGEEALAPVEDDDPADIGQPTSEQGNCDNCRAPGMVRVYYKPERAEVKVYCDECAEAEGLRDVGED